MVERILVPMDGSRQAMKALDWAVDLAKRYKARIVVLRVVTLSMLDIAWSSPSSGGPIIKKDFLKEAEKHDKKTIGQVRKYLAEKTAYLSEKGIEASSQVMVGDPADSIKTLSKKEKIDLIVMNTNGKGWFKRAIMGSVSDEILRTSKVPVLLIRPGNKKK